MNRTARFAGIILIIPAFIFWAVSMKFFIMGLSVDDTTGQMFLIAVALSVANTIIQVMGNSYTREELGWVLFIGWIASYVLGVSSNVYSLSLIMNIPIPFIEWAVCLSLGSMIEFMPEKFFVIFWREVFPNGIFGLFASGRRTRYMPNQPRSAPKAPSAPTHQTTQPAQSGQLFPARPEGMTREAYQDMIRQQISGTHKNQSGNTY